MAEVSKRVRDETYVRTQGLRSEIYAVDGEVTLIYVYYDVKDKSKYVTIKPEQLLELRELFCAVQEQLDEREKARALTQAADIPDTQQEQG